MGTTTKWQRHYYISYLIFYLDWNTLWEDLYSENGKSPVVLENNLYISVYLGMWQRRQDKCSLHTLLLFTLQNKCYDLPQSASPISLDLTQSLEPTHSPKWLIWAYSPSDLHCKDSAHNLTNHIAPLWGIPHQVENCSSHNVTGLQWLSSCHNLESPRTHVSTWCKALFVCLPDRCWNRISNHQSNCPDNQATQ